MEYSSDLNDKMIDLEISFDPSIIKSDPQSLSMKMEATNGPLTYEDSTNMTNYKVFSNSGFVLGMICLLFFLISSFVHKMIGL